MLHPKSLKSVAGLQTLGFEGFVPVSRLRHRRDDVPNVPGVYLVVSHPGSTPAFLAVGTGGHFKGKNPNEPIIRLQEEWVEGAIILYIFGVPQPHSRPECERPGKWQQESHSRYCSLDSCQSVHRDVSLYS